MPNFLFYLLFSNVYHDEWELCENCSDVAGGLMDYQKINRIIGGIGIFNIFFFMAAYSGLGSDWRADEAAGLLFFSLITLLFNSLPFLALMALSSKITNKNYLAFYLAGICGFLFDLYTLGYPYVFGFDAQQGLVFIFLPIPTTIAGCIGGFVGWAICKVKKS